MAVHSFKTVQIIPITIEEAWDFFSSPANLQSLIPSNISFRIISRHHGLKMYAGQIIEYKVRPVLNIPFYWMSEITHVQEETLFIDEQRFGPFTMWHHQHHFKKLNDAVEMTDIVYYKIPGWWLGDIMNAIYVKKEVKKVFDYRRERIGELFGGRGL